MKPKFTLPVLIAGLCLASSCSPAEDAPVAEPVATVEVTEAYRGDLSVTVTGYGVIAFDPARQRVVTTQVESRVAEILVHPGDTVSAGTALMRLAPSSASGLDLARAREDAAAAQSELERQERLRADGLASDADVERARTAAHDMSAQAAALIRNTGELRQVTAPISGVVDAVLASVGDITPPGAQLLRLAAPDAVQARINLEVEDAARLAVGDALVLSGLDGAKRTSDSRISAIDVRVDPTTRMAAILATVPAGQGFLSGEAVRAELVAETRTGVVLAPRQAILIDELGDYVFVAVSDLAQLRRVTVGETSGDLTEIVEGLAAGDKVVTVGAAILSDGMQLDIATGDSAR